MRKYLLQILGISTLKEPKHSLQIESFCLIISQTIRILLSSDNYFFTRDKSKKSDRSPHIVFLGIIIVKNQIAQISEILHHI